MTNNKINDLLEKINSDPILKKRMKELKKEIPEEIIPVLNETINKVNTWKELETQESQKIIIEEPIFENDDINTHLYLFREFVGASPSLILSDRRLNLGKVNTFIKPEKSILDIIEKKLSKKHFLYTIQQLEKKLAKQLTIPAIVSLFAVHPDLDFTKRSSTQEVIELLKKHLIQYLEQFQEDNEEYFFFVNTPPANIQQYKPKSEKDIKTLISLALTEGYNVDEHLFKIFLSQNISLDSHAINDIGKYSAHTIVVTGTKAGKTSLAEKTGVVVDGKNMSFSNLMGFSTADDVSEGSLNAIQEPLIIDEFEELRNNQDISRGALSLLEKGNARIMKGKKSLLVRYQNSFIFNSNPIFEKSEDYAKGKGLFELIDSIHSNTLALGSRIALVYYNPDTKIATKKKNIPFEDIEKSQKVFLALRYFISKWYVDLVLNNDEIKTWLEQTNDKEYIKEIKEIENVLKTIPELGNFLTGFKDNNKHMRGLALRMALWDTELIYKKLNNIEIPVDEILSICEDKYDYIKKLNISSFKKLLEKNDLAFFDIIRENKINKLIHKLRDCDKVLLYCFIKQYQESKQENMNILELKTKFRDVKSEIRTKESNLFFSKVINRFKKHEFNQGDLLEQVLGLKFSNINDEWFIEIINKEIFDIYAEVFTDKMKIKDELISEMSMIKLNENNPDLDNFSLKIYNYIKSKTTATLDELEKEFGRDVFEKIRKLLENGEIYESKPNTYRVI